MFPQLSDIEDKIHYRILSRANAVNAKKAAEIAGGSESLYEEIQKTSGLQNTSKLNTWVKAISGAVPAKGKSKGMVLQSIQNWEAFDKESFGASTNASYYGNTNIAQPRSGTIGMDLNGDPIDTSTATVDRMLRPSPIITGLEIKEGQDQISRECSVSIKCFTLGQMEVIQTYFMEPGYTLYIEYGWNTPNLVGPMPFTLFGGKIKAEDIIKAAANRGLNYDVLHSQRVKSNGDFDCFLGFIVGGTVASEGEVFNVTVNLRGQPGLPTYLQGQHRVNKLNTDKKVWKKDPKLQYPPEQIEDEGGGSPTNDKVFKAKQRFKYMFNELPAQRQNTEVKNLESNNSFVTLNHFINLDKTIQSNISHYTDPNWKVRATELFGGDFSDADVVQISNSEGTRVEIDKKDLFSSHKFIKMDLAVKILNSNNAIESYVVGGKKVSVRINIDNSVIGGFRYMFSTNPSKLIIPGEMPDFLRYFLNANDISHGAEVGGVFRAENIVIGDAVYPPIDNDIDGVSFVQKTATPAEIPYREGPHHWGYLKDLYVNLDLFNTKIQQSNKTISEVFLDILNEMSSAANSYWNFQIVESKNKNGDIILTVVDENFVGKPGLGARKAFYHAGIQSPFLESNLDLSIPAEMANKLILSRLSYSSNPDSQFAQGGSFFNSKTDLFLQSVTAPKIGAAKDETPTSDTEEDNDTQRKEELIKEFTDAGDEFDQIEKKGYKQVRKEKYDPARPGVIISYYEFEDPAIEKRAAELRAAKAKAKAEFEKINGFTNKTIEGEINERKMLSAKNTASENLKKITLLPNPSQAYFSKDEVGTAITDMTKLRTYFRVYTLRDVTYFDMLKQNAFQDKRKEKQYQLSHPLPITYRFKTMGVSGLRRGDMFVIDGIPVKYKNNGVFQITELEQVVEGSLWTTSVTGKYRQFIQEM